MTSSLTNTPGPQYAQPGTNDVFISYSRRDKAFVQTLDRAFRNIGRDPWIDWDDIRKGEDWWESIKRGIEAANTFIFVVSPDSVASKVCRQEIDYAAQHNKRFLPVIHREGFDPSQAHPSISRHNWLFFRESDSFEQAFQELLHTLDTDLEHVALHTRLLVRALEWEHGGHDSSYLLRGSDLFSAQQWLGQAINKEPRPTDLQAAYVQASLEARLALVRSRQKARWSVVLITVIANLAFIAAGLLQIRYFLIENARMRVEEAVETTLEAALDGIDGEEFAQLARLPPSSQQPLNNPLYRRHQAWIATIHKLVPNSFPETYILSDEPGQVEIVGDIYRLLYPEESYEFRETVAPYQPEMLTGLAYNVQNLSDPYYDEYGERLLSIYGPIRDAEGNAVGGLALQYNDEYVSAIQDYVAVVIRNSCIIAALWFIVSSWLILKATRPPKELLDFGQPASTAKG